MYIKYHRLDSSHLQCILHGIMTFLFVKAIYLIN
jgi:hypothetical protein